MQAEARHSKTARQSLLRIWQHQLGQLEEPAEHEPNNWIRRLGQISRKIAAQAEIDRGKWNAIAKNNCLSLPCTNAVTCDEKAQMLENRLRKLHNEEQRLQKQIRIANKHSDFADQVKQRRDHDAAVMEWHKANLKAQEDKQRQVNLERRSANRAAIKAH